VGHLNGFFAPRGGNLNKPISKSSNARGVARGGMLNFRIDRLIIPLKKLLNIWSQRDISIYGKINLVKSLALSKLIFICNVMETPKLSANEVNKITLDFIWNHKPPKIKYSTLIKTNKEGGLE